MNDTIPMSILSALIGLDLISNNCKENEHEVVRESRRTRDSWREAVVKGYEQNTLYKCMAFSNLIEINNRNMHQVGYIRNIVHICIYLSDYND